MAYQFPQHHQQQQVFRLPPPPPPPPHHHGSSSSGSSSSGSNGSSSGSRNYYGGSGSTGGGGTGGVNNNNNNNNSYPYKMSSDSLTAYSGFMFLAIGVFVLRTFNFFKQHCTKLENSKRQQGYLAVSNTKGVNGATGTRFTPYKDHHHHHHAPLRNRKQISTHNNPSHPEIPNVPPHSINTETMNRLQTTGIRITAHGVHCDPRKVWLTLDDEAICWQSEFQKEVPDLHHHHHHSSSSSSPKLVAVRGSLHRIRWQMIEYIDVGKRTDALKQATHVADHLCFSLLTPEGSLDLQANSQLERDSLVSCIGIQLDEILGGDWRLLAGGGGGGATPSSAAGVSSAAGSGAYSNSSFSTMNQQFPDYSVDV